MKIENDRLYQKVCEQAQWFGRQASEHKLLNRMLWYSTSIISISVALTANFEFKLGKLVGQKIDVKLIDNSARRKETDRIRQIVIDRETKKNKLSYKIVSLLVKKPLVEIIKFIRTGVVIVQEFLWSMERKLNKI